MNRFGRPAPDFSVWSHVIPERGALASHSGPCSCPRDGRGRARARGRRGRERARRSRCPAASGRAVGAAGAAAFPRRGPSGGCVRRGGEGPVGGPGGGAALLSAGAGPREPTAAALDAADVEGEGAGSKDHEVYIHLAAFGSSTLTKSSCHLPGS